MPGGLFNSNDFEESKHYEERSKKTLHSIRFAVEHYDFLLLLKCDTDSSVMGKHTMFSIATLKTRSQVPQCLHSSYIHYAFIYQLETNG